jgi:hypothetical protein
MGINLFDLTKEVVESAFPLAFMLLGEYISVESFKLLDLLLNLFSFSINHSGITSNSFEIWTENGIELLNDDTRLFKVT